MSMDLSGQTLGPYQIIDRLGQGGMATVYKAYQPNMDRTVAIKILPQILAQDPNFAGRFQQEARTIARLEHARILPVYDYGEHDGITYIVMRFLDGGTLAERIRDGGPMPVTDAARIIAQVSEGLDYAHSRGVIHRDIKPANIMLDSSGDAYITDFGIAKLVEGTAQFTGSGIVGTPAYVSPEQGLGQPLDARSDIYALGIVLYEMLTGRTPYEAETPMAVIVKHINEPLPSPTTINRNLSPEVEAVVMRALAKRPADRFDSCGEMAAALRDAVGGIPPAHRAPTASPQRTREIGVPAATMPVDVPETARVPMDDAGTMPVKAVGADVAAPPAAVPKKKTNWLLIGGIAVGVICLCLSVLFVLSRAGEGGGAKGKGTQAAGEPTDEVVVPVTPETTPAPGEETPAPGEGTPVAPGDDLLAAWMACPAGQVPVLFQEFTPGMELPDLPSGADIIEYGEEGFHVLRLTGTTDAPMRLPFGEQMADSTVNVLFVLPAGATEFGVHSHVVPGTSPGYGARFTAEGGAIISRGLDWLAGPTPAPSLDAFQAHAVRLTVIGHTVEMLYDGQPLLSADDPDPLPPGRFMVEVGNGVVMVALVGVCGPGEGGPLFADTFDAPPLNADAWQWQNEPPDPKGWKLADGRLAIPAIGGSGPQGQMPVLRLSDLVAASTRAVEVEVEFVPVSEGQGAGLAVLNLRGDVMLTLMRAFCQERQGCEGDAIYFEHWNEFLQNRDAYRPHIGGAGTLPPAGLVGLKIERAENMLVGFYRLPPDGEWHRVGEWPLVAERRMGGIGLGTMGGRDPGDALLAFFDNFTVWP